MHTASPPDLETGAFPSGTVAFLFADLAGLAGQWDAAFDVVASDVNRLVEVLLHAAAAHQGVVFKLVDASMQAAFSHPEDALAAAVAVGRAYASAGSSAPPRLAVHVGDATPRNHDYLAPALNRLARLIGASHPGQILVTAAAHDVLDALPADVSLLSLGRHRLRDLLEAEPVFQVIAPGLPPAFPPLRSLDGVPHNLPIQANQLIGREADLARIRGAWRGGERLVTLTGPGGVGKSRLSLQAAADNLERFPDGVWWTPLAAISDPALVLEAIAAALPLRLPAELPLAEALALRLRDRADLLILDNLEQVTSAAPAIERLLRDAPGLSILASSRIPLGLPDEFEIPVAPLPITIRDDAATSPLAIGPAVQLFLERAAAVRPGFTLSPDNEEAIVAICARLDGLPLALELAAARVRVLAPAALLARLDRSLGVLTGGARDLPGRQQTLRGAIQWSYDLLDAPAQSLFARLAVMAPGFTTAAAARVLRGEAASPGDLLPELRSLQQQSLLRRVDDSQDERWAMLATIHEFASEQLATMPDAAALRLTHAATYVRIAAEAAWFAASQDPEVAAAFEADHDNFRQALQTLRDDGARSTEQLLELTTCLADFWWVRGHASEGRRWLATAIDTAVGQPSLALARALAAAGLLAEAQSDLATARAFLEQALALFREYGFARGAADALTGLAIIARSEGDLDRARALHQEAYDVWTALDDELGAAGALLDLGVVSYLRGDGANAGPLLNEALDRFRTAGDQAGIAYAEQSLAGAAVMADDLVAAAAGFRRSLALWEALGNDNDAATDRMNLAETLILQGHLAEAETLLLTALDDLADLEAPARRGTALGLLGRISLERGDPGAAAPMLRDAVEMTWQHRDRAAAAVVLDTLAETLHAQRDPLAGAVLVAGDALRRATGLKRAPAYAQRLTPVRGKYAATPPFDRTADQLVETLVYRGLRR